MRIRLLLSVICLVAALCGCHSASNVQVLSNTEFMKRFSGATPETTVNVVSTNTASASVTSTNTANASATSTNETASIVVAPEVATPRLVAPGMLLTVTVAEDPNLNRQYMVPPSGIVELLGVGRLKVTGLTPDELAKKIKDPLERDYLQKATVAVSLESAMGAASPIPGGAGPVVAATGSSPSLGGAGGGVVYVLGNIGRPGPLMLPRDEVFTLTKVILAAGGIATFGDGSKVRVLRYDANGKKFETRVNVNRIMKNGDFEKDIVIQNGDWIIVPEKWINF
jgi:polysaccharide export outer membrane protein